MNNAYLGLAFVAGTALGAGGGYYLAKKRLDALYAEELTIENQKTRDFYEQRYKVGSFSNPVDAADTLVGDAADAMRTYAGEEATVKPEELEDEKDVRWAAYDAAARAAVQNVGKQVSIEDEIMITDAGVERVQDVVEKNIFDTNGDAVVLDISRRTKDRPYVITEEEFDLNEKEYDQISLTYYAGDNVLSDDQDGVIEHVDQIIGAGNLIFFGVGSDNDNLVFVRNEKLSSDYVITQRQDKYKVVVLSFDDDNLQHSDEPMRRKKPRWDD